MTYSCSDFADDLFDELARIGAIHQSEAAGADLVDNPGLQAAYALAGLARLAAVTEALEQFRHAAATSQWGGSTHSDTLREADDRARMALAQIEASTPTTRQAAAEGA